MSGEKEVALRIEEREHALSRRGFIAGAVAAAGGALALTGWTHAALAAEGAGRHVGTASVDMTSAGPPQLFLFDGNDACRNVAASVESTCATRAITGDCVRFAQELFVSDSAPKVIAGAPSYANFILLSGTAAEHGYRVLEESAQGPLTCWKLARVRRPTSSG